jgi:Rod binding domain-containing protein
MGIDTGMSSVAASSSVLDAQADKLVKQDGLSSKVDAKIEKAGKDFESILLGSWLQDQFQGIAMQALAGSLTKSGGIGIAKMITEHLRSAAETESGPKPGLPTLKGVPPMTTTR